MGRDRRFLLGLGSIALIAVGVRVLFTALVDPEAGRLSDAGAYHLLAHDLAAGLGYIRPFDHLLLHVARPTAEYPPLFPALVSAFDRVGVNGVDAQQLVVGTLVGTATVVLLGLVGRRVGGDTIGLVAAALAACYPMLFQADAILMTEGLYALLVTAALLLTYEALRAPAPSLWLAAALGAVLGLAALTRTEGLVLAVALIVGVALTARVAAGRRLAIAGVGLAVVLASVAPWTARNAARFHAFVPVSNNLGTVVDGANCDLTYGGPQIGLWRAQLGSGSSSEFQCFQGFDIRDEQFDEAHVARTHLREGLDYIRTHERRVPAVVAVRVLRTFALWPDQAAQIRVESLEGRSVGWQWAGTVMFWVLAALAVPGAMTLRRRARPLWPLLTTIGVVVVTAAVTYGNQRFRIGAEPAVLVLAAAGATALGRTVLGPRWHPVSHR
jgi:hypothetical protein